MERHLKKSKAYEEKESRNSYFEVI
jgi:hypothetical protein